MLSSESESPSIELAAKSVLYHLLVLLLRHYTVPATEQRETKRHYSLLQHICPILEYTDTHYEQKISLESLAQMALVGRHHFCQLFTTITGLRVNSVRQLFTGTSNQLGEFESGITANWFGAMPSVLIGGI